jgi:hypothetical protein
MKFKSDDRMGARNASVTNLKYYENVAFNHSRIRRLRWQRAGRACPHSQTRGEEYCDNG